MKSITLCAIISPGKVSTTSNLKTVPCSNIDMTENRSRIREGQRQVGWMKTFSILRMDLKHFSWGKKNKPQMCVIKSPGNYSLKSPSKLCCIIFH